MKGGLAAMFARCATSPSRTASASGLCACPTRSPKSSTCARPTRSSPVGLGGEFAITGEPTDMHIGIQAKGVLAMRIVVHGRAAHSSTPWLGTTPC